MFANMMVNVLNRPTVAYNYAQSALKANKFMNWFLVDEEANAQYMYKTNITQEQYEVILTQMFIIPTKVLNTANDAMSTNSPIIASIFGSKLCDSISGDLTLKNVAVYKNIKLKLLNSDILNKYFIEELQNNGVYSVVIRLIEKSTDSRDNTENNIFAKLLRDLFDGCVEAFSELCSNILISSYDRRNGSKSYYIFKGISTDELLSYFYDLFISRINIIMKQTKIENIMPIHDVVYRNSEKQNKLLGGPTQQQEIIGL